MHAIVATLNEVVRRLESADRSQIVGYANAVDSIEETASFMSIMNTMNDEDLGEIKEVVGKTRVLMATRIDGFRRRQQALIDALPASSAARGMLAPRETILDLRSLITQGLEFVRSDMESCRTIWITMNGTRQRPLSDVDLDRLDTDMAALRETMIIHGLTSWNLKEIAAASQSWRSGLAIMLNCGTLIEIGE